MTTTRKDAIRKLLAICLFAICSLGISAQKFALVDMEYILKNIPAYERANEQLNQVSKKWQAEVEAISTEAQTMYKNYQNEVVFLSQEQKKAKQDAIMEKEKQAAELKKKYFGPEGELFKKRRGERHIRSAGLSTYTRPCKRQWHHLRQSQDRHKQ